MQDSCSDTVSELIGTNLLGDVYTHTHEKTVKFRSNDWTLVVVLTPIHYLGKFRWISMEEETLKRIAIQAYSLVQKIVPLILKVNQKFI